MSLIMRQMIMMTVASWALAGATALGVEGTWINEEGDGAIEISIDDNGTLVGIGARGTGGDPDRRDVNNPDPALRNRKLLGAPILWGFKPDNAERTKWSGGKIYDPGNGNTYACKLELRDGKLKIRGYVGISMFGRTTEWTRLHPD